MRVLFLTHRLPYAPNRGDRVRAFHLLHTMAGFADVDLVSLVHDADEAAHVDDVRAVAASVETVSVTKWRNTVLAALRLPGRRPTTHTLLDAPSLVPTVRAVAARNRPDVILSFCSGVAPLALDPALVDIPLVLDMVDVDSAKWRALAETASFPLRAVYAREARTLSAFEARVARHAFSTLLVTERECATMRALAPDARIDLMENGVEADRLRPPAPPKPSAAVVFCGVMDYPPNVEAAEWLATDIWPLVRRRRPDAILNLVGSKPTPKVQRLASDADGVNVTGHVADVRPYLWDAAVSAAPLRTARGVQNKVLEAVAAGLPVVVTPIVMEGLPRRVRDACIAAGDAIAFADALVTLLNESPHARRTRAAAAGIEELTWAHAFAGLPPLLREAAATRRPDFR